MSRCRLLRLFDLHHHCRLWWLPLKLPLGIGDQFLLPLLPALVRQELRYSAGLLVKRELQLPLQALELGLLTVALPLAFLTILPFLLLFSIKPTFQLLVILPVQLFLELALTLVTFLLLRMFLAFIFAHALMNKFA